MEDLVISNLVSQHKKQQEQFSVETSVLLSSSPIMNSHLLKDFTNNNHNNSGVGAVNNCFNATPSPANKSPRSSGLGIPSATLFDPMSFMRWGSGVQEDPQVRAVKKQLKQRIMEISFSPLFKQLSSAVADLVLTDSQGCYKPWNTEGMVILSEGLTAGDQSIWQYACMAALVECLKIQPMKFIGMSLSSVDYAVMKSIGWSEVESLQSDSKTITIVQSTDPRIWESIIRSNWGLWSLSSISILGRAPDFTLYKPSVSESDNLHISDDDYLRQAYPYLSRIAPFMTRKILYQRPPSPNRSQSLARSMMSSDGVVSEYLCSFQLFQFPLAFLHQIDLDFWKQ